MNVCDRCGAPEGRCHHAQNSDYVLEPQEQYVREEATARQILRILVLGALILGAVFLFRAKLIPWAQGQIVKAFPPVTRDEAQLIRQYEDSHNSWRWPAK